MQKKEFIEDGFILLSRKIFNSKTFSSLNAIQKLITIYLILMANHKDNEWWNSYHKKFIIIKRGSFITSIESIRTKIKDRLVTTKKIRTCVELLKSMQFLTIETASGYSHITIEKYEQYQNGDNYKANKRASRGQAEGKPRATNNNGNNENNGKNVKDIYMEAVYLTKDEYKKLKEKFGNEVTQEKIEELNNYIKSKGKEKVYSSHYHTILNWDRKNKGSRDSPKKMMGIDEVLKMEGKNE